MTKYKSASEEAGMLVREFLMLDGEIHTAKECETYILRNASDMYKMTTGVLASAIRRVEASNGFVRLARGKYQYIGDAKVKYDKNLKESILSGLNKAHSDLIDSLKINVMDLGKFNRQDIELIGKVKSIISDIKSTIDMLDDSEQSED